jgi:hypothetical protein
MHKVVPLFEGRRFNAAHWVAAWEALGCHLSMGDAMGAPPEAMGGAILVLARRCLPEDPGAGRIRVLQWQLQGRGNREQVAAFLVRRRSTRGY